jgi:thiol-disulfide isomerase/thioredoxin
MKMPRNLTRNAINLSLPAGLLLVLTVLTVLTVLIGAARPDSQPGLKIGDQATDASFETLDGDHLWLSNYAGKVVMLDFWATWCGPCKSALPALTRIAKARQGQPFVLISVSEDRDGHPLRDFTASHGMTWTQTWDGNAAAQRLFKVKAYPTTILVDATGRIRFLRTGWNGGAERELNREIDRVLAAPVKNAGRFVAVPSGLRDRSDRSILVAENGVEVRQ